jgi:hypothetical protein
MRGIERDEQRRIRPQPPPARRVAAARRHVLRCRSSEMAPHRLRRGALNLTPWRSQRGPSQIDSHPLSTGFSQRVEIPQGGGPTWVRPGLYFALEQEE